MRNETQRKADARLAKIEGQIRAVRRENTVFTQIWRWQEFMQNLCGQCTAQSGAETNYYGHSSCAASKRTSTFTVAPWHTA